MHNSATVLLYLFSKLRFSQSEGTYWRFSSCQLQKLDDFHLLHLSVKQMRSPFCNAGLHTAHPWLCSATPVGAQTRELCVGLPRSPVVSVECLRQEAKAAQGRGDCSFVAGSKVDLNIYCKSQMIVVNV